MKNNAGEEMRALSHDVRGYDHIAPDEISDEVGEATERKQRIKQYLMYASHLDLYGIGNDAPDETEYTAYNWRDGARCKNIPEPELFFETGYDKEAKKFCNQCPVRQHCLNEAVEDNLDFGVWGGMNSRERGKLTRQMLRRSPRR